jgi:DNA modification methylase
VGARPGGGAQGDNWKGAMTSPNRMPIPGLKPKDLVGIPWRVAFALQSDGWYLRSDIVWAKPNPMPESVTDRPTKAHEYLFLLTKRERYFYDAEAIKEPSTGQNGAAANFARATKDHVIPGQGYAQHRLDRNGTMDNGARNKRSVWTIASSPYPEAHFATFPRDLVTPCILAGSRPGDTVLDPFMGSGTVAMVAQDLGRQWRGCELNPDYAVLAARRTRQQGLAL